MVPAGGIEALGAEPQRIVLTNRHHYRDSDRFGCPVLCHEAGLHEFDGGVEGFAFGDELAPGVRALEVGVLTPEETALHLAATRWRSPTASSAASTGSSGSFPTTCSATTRRRSRTGCARRSAGCATRSSSTPC